MLAILTVWGFEQSWLCVCVKLSLSLPNSCESVLRACIVPFLVPLISLCFFLFLPWEVMLRVMEPSEECYNSIFGSPSSTYNSSSSMLWSLRWGDGLIWGGGLPVARVLGQIHVSLQSRSVRLHVSSLVKQVYTSYMYVMYMYMYYCTDMHQQPVLVGSFCQSSSSPVATFPHWHVLMVATNSWVFRNKIVKLFQWYKTL